MRFSVVIPTHNRLALLRDAVETVRRQRGAEWELVVFDNASTDDIAGFVNGLSDPRIRYDRSDIFLPVTDSWNRAIDLATGDYVTFLGDDDGLTPDYFTRIQGPIASFANPDVVYCNIYQFMHPGVAPWEPAGYVADIGNAFFFQGRTSPFLMTSEQISAAVNGSVRLRRNFAFNMQAFLFSRSFLQRLRHDGPIFRSPFPDYYLANVALARARSTVVVPTPMSVAGVSKASFGFMLFNGLEEQGSALLNTELADDPMYAAAERFLLPGPLYNTNYVITMKHVVRNAGPVVKSDVNFERYRRLQVFTLLSGHNSLWWPRTPIGLSVWERLSASERLWARALLALLGASGKLGNKEKKVLPELRRRLGPYGFQPAVRHCDVGSYTNLAQLFDALEAGVVK